jgi:TRAP-type uncharacterized transport system fused permease subunit
LEIGSKDALIVIAACACAGIIIGVTTLTGLGLKFTGIIVDLGGGSLFLTLLLTMIACYILGMALPTTAAYIMVAVLAAPALIELGVPVLAAHLFVFYCALLSAITPPVALAAFAGAGIAGADPIKTGFTAAKIGAMLFLLPFAFVYVPSLLIHGHEPLAILGSFVILLLSVVCFSSLLHNWIFRYPAHWERIALIAASSGLVAGLVLESVVAGIVGLALAAIVYLSQSGQAKRILRWRSASNKKP